jgi:hypothetical protein
MILDAFSKDFNPAYLYWGTIFADIAIAVAIFT